MQLLAVEADVPAAAENNTNDAEWQSAPANLLVCSVEADAPDKFCSGELAGEHQAPAGSQALAVEAGVHAAAVLPTELVYGSPRVLAYDELEQEQLRQDDALLLEEDRLQAAVRAARYQ